MTEFTEEEKHILAQFVSNIDRNVFVLSNLPEVIKGALFSRYSRSPHGLRALLLKEFIHNKETAFAEITQFSRQSAQQSLAVQKAQEFYDRILDGYGDDSIGELGGAHVAIENVSIIATKILEDSRIGGSPLEKSTRYIFFDQKVGGDYQFYKEPTLMLSEFKQVYLETCNMLFDTYTKLIEPLTEFIQKTFPKDTETSDAAYKFSVRARACDALRGLLPASTLTNMGVFGNGRFFEYLILKLRSDELAECSQLADDFQAELNKTIPSFVRRCSSDNKHFPVMKSFIAETRDAVRKLAQELIKASPQNAETVTLVEYDNDAENKAIAALLYPHTALPLPQLREQVSSFTTEQKLKLLHEYLHRRTNRRHKPGRAFELPFYTFDILGDYGCYRDLHRHRSLTQERQLLSTAHGFVTPELITAAGLESQYKEALEKASHAYKKIAAVYPLQAQYIVPLAYRIRWMVNINLRSLYWLAELRSIAQGHQYYREIAQLMYKAADKVHPALCRYMQVDMNSYDLGRLEAEKKKAEKKQLLHSSL